MSDAWSITDGYWDTKGGWHETIEATRAALRAAMDGDEAAEPPPPPPMWFVPTGRSHPLQERCALTLEDGTQLEVDELPPELPFGYHELTPLSGAARSLLVVSPRRCTVPDRSWGWAAQLYALRSAASWGMGDLGDLRELARWSASLGAGTVMINPLHATSPGLPQQPSPYYASSRLWRNVCYLRVTDLPGVSAIGPDLARLDDAGRALNEQAQIERDEIYPLKLAALELLHRQFEQNDSGHAEFDAFVAAQGEPLERFSTWCALAEEPGHGPSFPAWPAEHRHPASPHVREFASARRERVRFHQWCQWHLDRQLAAAAAVGVGLVSDLAVGFDPAGADAWAFQDQLALGCRVGAPPDTFNTQGQDWGLPPFVPWKLRHDRYGAFIATIRAMLTHGAGLRIDHVMGLFRLYWIPPDRGAREGAYVRYSAHELLDLVALEAHRANAYVVGEDLGTVEDEVREDLDDRGILSCRLLWFEEELPERYPRQAFACITTHDLPTVAGVWTGADLEHRRRMGLATDGSDDAYFRSRLHAATGLDDTASVNDVVVAAHRALATAPSAVVTATLDDAVGAPDRPNQPGTVDEWPNWRIPLPVRFEDLVSHPLAQRVARTLDDGVRATDAEIYRPPS